MEDIRDDMAEEKVEEPKESNESNEATNNEIVETKNEEKNLQLEKEQKAMETFNTLKETNVLDVVRAVQNKQALEIAEQDSEVKTQINENAKQSITSSMEVVANENATQLNKSYFERYKSASKMYGFKDERPKWQQRLMVVGSSIWFVIYFIIASVTVCPLSVFFDVFKNIFKAGWLAMLISFIMYLVLTVGLPIITNIYGNNG